MFVCGLWHGRHIGGGVDDFYTETESCPTDVSGGLQRPQIDDYDD